MHHACAARSWLEIKECIRRQQPGCERRRELPQNPVTVAKATVYKAFPCREVDSVFPFP